VRERYPKEVQALRSAPHVARALIVIVDADALSTEDRFHQLEGVLVSKHVGDRGHDEPVGIFVPRRNVETWFAYLRGERVDESSWYPRLARGRDCAPLVGNLKVMCDRDTLREPAPDSMRRACAEWKRIIGQMLR